MNSLLCQIASLGPIGRKLPAPGTAGSLVALIIGYFIYQQGYLAMLSATVATVVIGVMAADAYENMSGKKDSSEIIIDEVAGQFAVLLCIPKFASQPLIWFGLAFILFRFFDILKIWPINKAEQIKGGVGVMADDIVAASWAGICLLGIFVLLSPYLAG